MASITELRKRQTISVNASYNYETTPQSPHKTARQERTNIRPHSSEMDQFLDEEQQTSGVAIAMAGSVRNHGVFQSVVRSKPPLLGEFGREEAYKIEDDSTP